MEVTAYRLAARYLGVHEIAGEQDHPLIRWWLMLCGFGPQAHDEIPNCGAFVHAIAWELQLQRPRFPARARWWLTVGSPISQSEAKVGFDIIVLKRGSGDQPGPDVINAPGHVGFFGGPDEWDDSRFLLLGANQSDQVSVVSYPWSRVLGVRRLA